ncbi:hypothetical protein [Streptomyces subrutilus]|uniref:hypothetical protein n=1 Tax=Streptomyces subrutilus TaxID=36818 RepID=UPI003F4D3F61
MTPGPFPRAVRAAMFAALCVLLAATGHVLMSGAAVPSWALGAAFAATAAAAWALADRERGLLGVTLAAVAVQCALHAAFTLVQAPPERSLPATGGPLPPPAGAPGAGVLPESAAHAHHAAHGMHEMAAASAGAAETAVAHGSAAASSTGMLAAHLLAAVLCGLWLAHGERASFRVLRAVATRLWSPLRLLVDPHRPATPLPPRLRPRRPRRRRPFRRLFLVHAITSRGPPAGTAVR